MTGEFSILLAGTVFRIHPLCPELSELYQEYFCELPADVELAATEEDLAYELRVLEDQYGSDPPLPRRPRDYMENLAVFRLIANRMPEHDTVLFHGSVIAVEEKAYLFAAPSGTGKTTHTQLWLEQLPDAHVLNGDKPFLKVGPDQVYACGGPWRGKEGLGRNEILPLEAICILERSPENHIQTITPEEASSILIQRTHIPRDPKAMLKAIRLLDQISRRVRLYRLGCNMEPEAAQVSIRAMVRPAPEGLA